MEWKGVKVPAASIGPKAWRDQAIKAVGLAEAATEITSQRYNDTPFRSATLYEDQARRLARREACKRLPGELTEKPESLAKYRARQRKVGEKRAALAEARQKVCIVGDGHEESQDVLYKVPEGQRGGWGIRVEMELLPFLRDMCVQHSNQQMGSYMLQTRSVIGHICETLNRLNAEIFRLQETRDKLRLALAAVRKALLINRMSGQMRKARPLGERVSEGGRGDKGGMGG